MQVLRRAIGRKEVILSLFGLLLAGTWFGWNHFAQAQLVRLSEDQQALQAYSTFAGLASVSDLLDSGDGRQALATTDQLISQYGDQPTLLRYKILAQVETGDWQGVAATSKAALNAGATGPDAAIALSAEALRALAHPEIARPLAEQALQQTAGAEQADLLARVAYAAAVRAEGDQPGQVPQSALIAEVLEPLLKSTPNQPQPAWQAKFWRRGLALLADNRLLTGDPVTEQAGLALLRQSCPPDAWECYFRIPDKALRAARSPSIESGDHARVAALTAVAYLYITSGDRLHGDAAMRRAIQAYARLLENYDGWEGAVMRTVTPQGRFKRVGEEFYTYRNRMESLVKYSADYWGIQVVRGLVSLDEALAQCDQRLFRAMVRLRADQQADPVQIMREEQIRPLDYATVADWFAKRAHTSQAEWERQRASVLDRVGQEEVRAQQAIEQARALLSQGWMADAAALLQEQLVVEPALSETGTSLRCELAWLLITQARYYEASQMLARAEQVVETGDAHPPFGRAGQRGRIAYYRVLIARRQGNLTLALALAEQLVGDEGLAMSLRARTLLDLVQMNIEVQNRTLALDAYRRLESMPVTSEDRPVFLEPILQAARSRLSQQGWL